MTVESWKNDMGEVRCKKRVEAVAARLYKINCSGGMLREWGEHGLNWGDKRGRRFKEGKGGLKKERRGFKGEKGDSKKKKAIQRRRRSNYRRKEGIQKRRRSIQRRRKGGLEGGGEGSREMRVRKI